MKYLRRFFCWMGWHKVGPIWIEPNDPLHFLGKARCQWCGFEGLVDSQGNLF